MDAMLDYVRGNLSTSGRIWSAAAPAIFIIGYLLLGAVVFAVRNKVRGKYVDEEIAGRGSSVLLGMALRQYFSWITQPVFSLLRLSNLPPSSLTTLSVLLAIGAAVSVAAGRFALGGWLYVLSGLCDFFDGRIARTTGSASPMGAALDSVLDRVSDGIMLVGLSWYYRMTWVLPVIGTLMIGSFMVSYVRAKAESLNVEMKSVGLMQRPERIVYLGLGVALSPIISAIYVPHDPHPPHTLAILVIVLMTGPTVHTAAARFRYLLGALAGDNQKGLRERLDHVALLRFSLCTSLATAVDLAAVVALMAYTTLAPWQATFLGCLVGGAVNNIIGRPLVFNRVSPPVPGSRYGFVCGSSALLNSGGVAVLFALPTMHLWLAWPIARVAVFFFWNYPLNRDYLFSHVMPESSADPVDESN